MVTRGIVQTPKENSPPSKYKWVPISYGKHGSIIAVDHYRLPVPLQLPSYLIPIGQAALLDTDGGKTKGRFSIYFNQKDDQKIRKWTSAFPDKFILVPGSYVRSSLKLRSRNFAHTWEESGSAKGGFGAVNFLFIPWDRMPKHGEAFDEDGESMIRSMTSINSPIRHQTKFIEMAIAFFPKVDMALSPSSPNPRLSKGEGRRPRRGEVPKASHSKGLSSHERIRPAAAGAAV